MPNSAASQQVGNTLMWAVSSLERIEQNLGVRVRGSDTRRLLSEMAAHNNSGRPSARDAVSQYIRGQTGNGFDI
jgi:hypothetical protein